MGGHETFDAAVAADIALGTVRDWLCHGGQVARMDSIIFAFHTAGDEKLYVERWPEYFPKHGPAARVPAEPVPAARVPAPAASVPAASVPSAAPTDKKRSALHLWHLWDR